MLSKSKYTAGLQCPRRLWLACHEPDLADSWPDARSALLDEGAEIGRRARELFADGALVDDAAWHHSDAVARTRALLSDPQVGAIFEAAFEHAGVRIRVDVLERLPGGTWGLREVKAGTRVRDVHLHDVALQRFVLEGAGVPLRSVEVVHVDPDYVRGEHGIDWTRFFRRVDVSDDTAVLLPDIPGRVAAHDRVLELAATPVVEPGPHCFRPYRCDFWGRCTATKPADWVFRLPWLEDELWERLEAAGVERITDIPDDFPLGPLQARARRAWRTGSVQVEPDLTAALAVAGPPADYLDFETTFPAIPLYAGTRPYQQIPFQWSLHRLDGAGRISHAEFLADARSDPRTAFADALLAALREPNGPVLVWSSFESYRLAELAGALPARAAEIAAVQAHLVDLLPLVRAHVYHPAFMGSYSIKRVAPVLAPAVGYDDLEGVADGAAAATALARLARGLVESADEQAALRRALLAYCKRDTLALLEVHAELRRRAAEGAR
jgi:predicted RecB family nuclease